MRNLILYSCLFFFLQTSWAQKPPETKAEFEKTYQRRIRQEMIKGVYIPKDLTEAFKEFNRLIDKESKQKFKSIPEEVAVQKLHFSFGRWIIHNWGFYQGSRFTVYLNKLGLYSPDDMARFVMVTYHRNLNREKLNVKEVITSIQEKRKSIEAAEKEKRKKTVLKEEKRIRN